MSVIGRLDEQVEAIIISPIGRSREPTEALVQKPLDQKSTPADAKTHERNESSDHARPRTRTEDLPVWLL